MRRLLQHAAIDLSPLRHRDFRLLLTGQLVTFLGTQITYVAVPYQVYQLTDSPLAVGLLGLAELGPVLLFALVGGAFADARDRRGMILRTEVAFLAASAMLLVNALQPAPSLIAIYVVAAIQAALFALQRPSLDALLPRLVERHEIPAAAALSGIRGSAGMLIGPAVGGLLLAAGGPAAAYAVDLLSFGVSLVVLAAMRTVPPPDVTGQVFSLARVREGVDYARSRPELIGTYAVDLVAMIFGMPSALFPFIAERFGGPAVVGLMYAAPAAGAFVATATSGWVRHVHRHAMAVVWAAVGWGLAIAAFGFAESLPVALLLLALAGGSDAISGIFRMTIWNQTIPDNLRGRLASIEMLSYSTGPLLGNFEAGVAAALFGIRTSVVSGGVLCVIGSLLCAALLPGFRRYDARTWHPATQRA